MDTPLPLPPRVRPPPFPTAPIGCIERRRYPRFSAAVEVTYNSGHNFFSGRTRDISEGGLFLESRARLESGDPLQVRLRLMKHLLTIDCEVMWVLADERGETRGLGVRFIALDEEARRAIEAFMSLRDPMEFLVDPAEPVSHAME